MTHTLSSAEISTFSLEISKFCYIKKYICRLSYFIVFKDFFDKHGYNFDDVSKNGYSRFS